MCDGTVDRSIHDPHRPGLSKFAEAVAIFPINHHKDSIRFGHRQKIHLQLMSVENRPFRVCSQESLLSAST